MGTGIHIGCRWGVVGTVERSFAVTHNLQSDHFPQEASYLSFHQAPLLGLSSCDGDVIEIRNDAETYAATIYNCLHGRKRFRRGHVWIMVTMWDDGAIPRHGAKRVVGDLVSSNLVQSPFIVRMCPFRCPDTRIYFSLDIASRSPTMGAESISCLKRILKLHSSGVSAKTRKSCAATCGARTQSHGKECLACAFPLRRRRHPSGSLEQPLPLRLVFITTTASCTIVVLL